MLLSLQSKCLYDIEAWLNTDLGKLFLGLYSYDILECLWYKEPKYICSYIDTVNPKEPANYMYVIAIQS